MIHRRIAAIEREKRLYEMNYWGLVGGWEREGLNWIYNTNMWDFTFRICHSTRQDTASSAISALTRVAEGQVIEF